MCGLQSQRDLERVAKNAVRVWPGGCVNEVDVLARLALTTFTAKALTGHQCGDTFLARC